MGTHRASAVLRRTPRRRLAVGIATAAFGISGLGFLAASAQAAPPPTFSTERFNELMSLPLDRFMEEAKKHDPADKTPDENGIRWDNDGCSDPFGIFKGGRAEDACVRHDMGYRTLQQNGMWNKSSKPEIDKKFYDDLKNLHDANAVDTPLWQKFGLEWGVYIGTEIPCKPYPILPCYDQSTEVPYTFPGPTPTPTPTPGPDTGAGGLDRP
ncbi:phospholipase A2 [Streptomyces halobius]|uniref:Phospholipase n=1 Tax=Streptomyces halobius TaxID=2879846 RepID=A0ABY4MCV3_9ACTN|nr:phospholipase A2 [Streptomyces halobius]UQA94151.1 phospholipase [Streptomyces halobius]